MYIENIEQKVVIIMRNFLIVEEMFQCKSNERYLIVIGSTLLKFETQAISYLISQWYLMIYIKSCQSRALISLRIVFKDIFKKLLQLMTNTNSSMTTNIIVRGYDF